MRNVGKPAGTGYNLEWVVRSVGNLRPCRTELRLTVRLILDIGGAPAFFKKGSLAGLGCVSQVAK